MNLLRWFLLHGNPIGWIYIRLCLSLAKHRSLTGHPRMALRLARLLPGYDLADDLLWRADGAPEEISDRRRRSFSRLSLEVREHERRSIDETAQLSSGLADLQLMERNRVPFPFRKVVSQAFPAAQVVTASHGRQLRDPDGRLVWDLGGSYGVNLLGVEFYKACMDRAAVRVRDLGLVLGPYHPVVQENVRLLQNISGLDQVSFHMSGTEAVMQAVRLARYHTGRTHVVRFCGAYHGWWDGVQGGPGNPLPARHLYTLEEMSSATLRVLEQRRDIACILVNPLQALTPNRAPVSDAALVTGRGVAQYDKPAYARWLRQLREVCTRRGIVLIFDEVFLGFRLARGGVQEYFGVQADMVTYGKTLGGGLPVGVLCGRRGLMQRYREGRPADLCFARGTFAAHPHVMASMNEFLRALEDPEVQSGWHDIDGRWNGRAAWLNQQLSQRGLPVQVANMASIFTVNFTTPGRYLWMLQFYLREQGMLLPWVGTGRFIFSHDFTDEEFRTLSLQFVEACQRARDDGWFWCPEVAPQRALSRLVRAEMIQALRRRLGPVQNRSVAASTMNRPAVGDLS